MIPSEGTLLSPTQTAVHRNWSARIRPSCQQQADGQKDSQMRSNKSMEHILSSSKRSFADSSLMTQVIRGLSGLFWGFCSRALRLVLCRGTLSYQLWGSRIKRLLSKHNSYHSTSKPQHFRVIDLFPILMKNRPLNDSFYVFLNPGKLTRHTPPSGSGCCPHHTP